MAARHFSCGTGVITGRITGKFLIDGLEPGEYAVSVHDNKESWETNNVIVNKDSETEISLFLEADSS